MSFPKYPEYKESGIEILTAIPIHWQVIFMKRFAQLAYGDALPTDMRDDGQIPVYGSNGIVGIHSTSNTKSPVILVGRKGSYGALNWSNQPVFAIDTVYFIDENYCSANLRWLFWTLHIADFSGCSQDTGVPGLSRSLAHNTCLPFPSSQEQPAIAAFLDRETAKIDALVAEQERLIELLKEKRQAVISHAVTKGLDPNVPMKDSGLEWLGDMPEHWNIIKVSHLFSAKKGSNAAQLTKEYCADIDGEHPVYSGQTDNNGVMACINEYEFDTGIEGVILSTTVGAKAMSVSHINGKFSLSQNCMIIISKSKNASIRFFYYHFHPLFKYERDMIPCHMQPSFRMEDLYGYFVALPPLAEQDKICAHLDSHTAKIDELVLESEKAIILLKERRSALISAAVTGKIDVRGLADATQ